MYVSFDMLNIKIITIGNLKEKYWTAACEEYAKRLSRFCRFDIVELAEAKLPSDPSDGEIARALDTEGTAILAAIPPRAHKTALCVEGKSFSSPDLARLIERTSNISSELVFIIGGSYGLADKVKSACDVRMSFSPMTFPHQLMRVILCEQLYRAMTINNNIKYHK